MICGYPSPRQGHHDLPHELQYHVPQVFHPEISKGLLLTSLHVYLLSQQYNHMLVSKSRAMTPPSSGTPVQCPHNVDFIQKFI